MSSVGVRELRQRASELLRRVSQGETIEITDRGHPVALLAPFPQVARSSGRAVLGRIDLVRVNDRVLHAAAAVLPEKVRSLDAIHLATAQQLGPDLGTVVTYDERMLAAAKGFGLRVASPR